MSKLPNMVYVNKGRDDAEFAGRPPLVKLTYEYAQPFAKMADVYLKRYNWEGRQQLTSICNVS